MLVAIMMKIHCINPETSHAHYHIFSLSSTHDARHKFSKCFDFHRPLFAHFSTFLQSWFTLRHRSKGIFSKMFKSQCLGRICTPLRPLSRQKSALTPLLTYISAQTASPAILAPASNLTQGVLIPGSRHTTCFKSIRRHVPSGTTSYS